MIAGKPRSREGKAAMTEFLAWNMDLLRTVAAMRTPLLDAFNALITHIGDETVFMIVLMFVFWCVDKKRGYYLMMVGFTGTLLNQFLKLLLRIPRPWVLDPEFEIVESARSRAAGYSFPSGHTQNAVGIFGGIAGTSRHRGVKLACIIIAVLVPFSRLYLGVHTPFDVTAAAAAAVALLFLFDPVYRRIEEKPRFTAGIFLCMILCALLFRRYAQTQQLLAVSQGLPEEDLANFAGAVKNACCMLGASAGALVVYLLERKYIKFETAAVWWAQLLKLAGGLVLVVGVKSVLKAPLYALMGADGDAVRYGVMILTAGVLWPLTFRWFGRLGKKKADTLQ